MKTKKQIKETERRLGIKPGKCGSGWSEWVVPDRPAWLWFISLRWCCREHDVDYELGGSEIDRLVADTTFKHNIMRTYRRSWLWRFKSFRFRAERTARLYYNAVRNYGAPHFNYVK